ncbi:hypothetical protein MACH15_10040 [Maricaulis maris]|nr:hypothetical protein MACH15_10040 [Maricaulis maris]
MPFLPAGTPRKRGGAPGPTHLSANDEVPVGPGWRCAPPGKMRVDVGSSDCCGDEDGAERSAEALHEKPDAAFWLTRDVCRKPRMAPVPAGQRGEPSVTRVAMICQVLLERGEPQFKPGLRRSGPDP